jgi:hypothetical protein
MHTRFVWNPSVHNRVHKSLPLLRTLSQINPVHTLTLIKTYVNIGQRGSVVG